MTLMYWHIGERINREILGGERAAYGHMIVEKLANKLTSEYGGSQFCKRSLHRMMQFATVFPDLTIVTPLVTQLSWSHFLQVCAGRIRHCASRMWRSVHFRSSSSGLRPYSRSDSPCSPVHRAIQQGCGRHRATSPPCLPVSALSR